MAPQKPVGIDVSKDSFTLAILSPEDGSFSTHTLSFSHKDLRRLPLLLNSPCRIAVESGGPYSTLLMGNLRKMGLRPLLINPLRIKRFSSSLSLRLTKTDPIDARTIALFLASDHNTAPSPDPKRQSLAELSRQVEALSQSIASLKNRIRQLLHTLFPELPNPSQPLLQVRPPSPPGLPLRPGLKPGRRGSHRPCFEKGCPQKGSKTLPFPPPAQGAGPQGHRAF